MAKKQTLLDKVRATPTVRRGPKSWFDDLPKETQAEVLELRAAHQRGELPHTKTQLYRIARQALGLTISEHAWMYWWGESERRGHVA
jgi:hypothetical protein